MAYATWQDLEARWRTLTASERATATVLLDDAATIIDAWVRIDQTNAHQLDSARYVSCSMVRRSMSAQESEMFGITQASATMGPFNQQATFQNPTGELYLSGSEKGMLGANTSFIDSLRPKIQPVLGGAYHGCP